jgi:hypothetical protein
MTILKSRLFVAGICSALLLNLAIVLPRVFADRTIANAILKPGALIVLSVFEPQMDRAFFGKIYLCTFGFYLAALWVVFWIIGAVQNRRASVSG